MLLTCGAQFVVHSPWVVDGGVLVLALFSALGQWVVLLGHHGALGWCAPISPIALTDSGGMPLGGLGSLVGLLAHGWHAASCPSWVSWMVGLVGLAVLVMWQGASVRSWVFSLLVFGKWFLGCSSLVFLARQVSQWVASWWLLIGTLWGALSPTTLGWGPFGSCLGCGLTGRWDVHWVWLVVPSLGPGWGPGHGGGGSRGRPLLGGGTPWDMLKG